MTIVGRHERLAGQQGTTDGDGGQHRHLALDYAVSPLVPAPVDAAPAAPPAPSCSSS